MDNQGRYAVKTERPSTNDDAVSSHSNSAEEQAKIQQLELKQRQMQQQMAQMMQIFSAQNGAGNLGGDASYPCPGFGQLPFKREPEPSFQSSSSSSSVNGSTASSNKSIINNNSAGTELLTKEKLWDLYLAGRVSLDGIKDVKASVQHLQSEAADSDVEEIVEEEEDPSREGFSLNDWDLVFDDGKIAAILCEPCRKSGKEPIPIRGDTLDKLKSFGEQHLVFRHNHSPKGHPHQVGPHPNRCKTCKCFFRAEKLLERHSKTCVVMKKEVEAINLPPCKVELSRSKVVEAEVSKKRKLSTGGGGGAESPASEKRRFNGKVEPGVQKESSSSSSKPTKKNGQDYGRNVGIKSFFKASDKSKEPSKNNVDSPPPPSNNDSPPPPSNNDSPPPSNNDSANKNDVPAPDNDDDEGYDGEEKHAGLPTDLITLGDRWHEGDKPEGGFACPLCKTRPLSRPIFIEDHVAAHHFKQKRYVCTICRKKNEEEEDEKNHVQCAWSHKSTLNEHLQKNHSLQFARQEKLNFKLMVIEPLHPDAVNTMRLFFKLYPKKGGKVKEKYTPKRPTAGDNNQKKSKCPECDQKFYTQEERTLIDHIMWRHRDAPRYHCHHCESDAGFGMVAGFEDHCKREHGCDKNDFVSLLLMKVDKVPEELAKQYYIDDNDYQDLHKGREVISDDEEDMPEKKEEVVENVPDMKIGFRRKEMLFVCRNNECDWTLSSRELFLVDKINKHIKTHQPE